jgi:hypothetical protein
LAQKAREEATVLEDFFPLHDGVFFVSLSVGVSDGVRVRVGVVAITSFVSVPRVAGVGGMGGVGGVVGVWQENAVDSS